MLVEEHRADHHPPAAGAHHALLAALFGDFVHLDLYQDAYLS